MVPVALCYNNCTHRGNCLRRRRNDGSEPSETPECFCKLGWRGIDCSEHDAMDEWPGCWFSIHCSGRGACTGGWCHCQPGWFGLACERCGG